MEITKLVRKNIRNLVPYSTARSEFQGEASIWLDANESPYETGFNRYPDPNQTDLKREISQWKGISMDHIFLGNGSDEAIDLLFRAFCEPKRSETLIFPPTYGMYEVCAAINNVKVTRVPLTNDFTIPVKRAVSKVKGRRVKLTFICSPNNPTGNLIPKAQILELCKKARGIVVVDEAYIDFSIDQSVLDEVNNTKNLVVLQTFSKAWGLAGARLGVAYADPQIVGVLNSIKPPYNVNTLTQNLALENLAQRETKKAMVKALVEERDNLKKQLNQLKQVKKVYPSDANFLLVEFSDARKTYRQLLERGIVTRDRSGVIPFTLRITVGTAAENKKLIAALQELD